MAMRRVMPVRDDETPIPHVYTATSKSILTFVKKSADKKEGNVNVSIDKSYL